MINIPEKQRAEFDRVADLAVQKECFTPSEIASELEISVLVASIMVGYMEKASLVTKGKGDDVRRARITLEEWDAIGRKIENYEPVPEPEPQVFEEEPQDCTAVDLSDIIPGELKFMKKTLCAEEGFIRINEGDICTAIAFEDINVIFLHRGRLFAKSTMTLSPDTSIPMKGRADTVSFKNREFGKIKELAISLAERLGAELVEY